MKKILIIISLFMLATACQKAEMPFDEGQDCLVTINTVGEITTSEEDLSRAAASLNDLYAVQVYRGGEAFAFGIFDDVSKMQLNLKSGSSSYDIRMCLVRDAKTYLKDYFSLTNNGLQTDPSRPTSPFRFNLWYDNYYLYTNKFFYNSNNYLWYYSSSTATGYSTDSDWDRDYYGDVYYYNDKDLGYIRQGTLLGTNYPTCTDWFYGEVNAYKPNGETAVMDMELKRTGFRLKYELSGVTDGEVTVQVYNDSRTFINNTTNTSSYESEEQFVAFYDTHSAWQYADNYTENMQVAVTWKRGIGVTQDLGKKTIQVKRNCLNTIRITLSSDDKGAGVSLQTENEDSMGKTDTVIPVA